MPRVQTELPRTDRIELRTSSDEKALLVRAAALERLDLTTFVLRAALPQAKDVVAAAESLQLSERDSLRILELLEKPPSPAPRLIAAAKARLRRA
jgi:uncharacterized protein (DUF1778 family)